MITRSAIGALLLTTAIGGTLFAANLPERDNAQHRHGDESSKREKKERDDPGARARWMDQWYNENHGHVGSKTNSASQHRGVWSQSYQRFLLEAAKRERSRYAAKMPVSASAKIVMDPSAPILARSAANSLSRDLKWTNIGPTKANFIRNGVTLNVTDAGRVNAIVSNPANPNTLYVAFSGGGLWKTTDGGAFWQAKTETLGTLSVGTVEIDPNNPNTLYLGLGDPFDGTGLGIMKMTDGGDTWADPVLLGTSTSIRNILVAPGNSNIVLVATNAGLYRSTDAGKTYSQVAINTGAGGTPGIWSIASGGGSNIVLSLEATPGSSNDAPATRTGQIWRSTDNGANWVQANGVTHTTGLNRIRLASAPSNRLIMYAMASKPRPSGSKDKDLGNLFKSTDGGVNWVSIGTNVDSTYKVYTNANSDSNNLEDILNGQGWYNQVVAIDPSNPNIAYFGGALLSAKTTNGGDSYTILTDWLADFGLPYVHADFHASHISSNGTLYFGTDGGIFASSNGGNTFTHTLNEGITSHLVYNVCSTPADANRVLTGLQDNGSRLREGTTSIFNQVVGGDGFGCNVNRTNASQMIATVQYLSVRKSVNNGDNFITACTGIPECGSSENGPFRVSIVPWAGDVTGNTLYTYANKIAYKTSNYATTWIALGTTGLPSDLFIRGIGVAKTGVATPNTDDVVGIVANGGRVFLSTDSGANWTQAAALPNNGLSTSSIAFDPVDRNIVYVTSVAPDATRSHIWRSTNFGLSWAVIDGNGFPFGIPVNQVSVDPVVRTTLYAATHLGVYRSMDSGTNWERLGAFLPLVNVMDIAVSADGNQVRAATFGRGVWELSAVGINAVPVANFTVAKSNLTATLTDTSTDSDGTIVRRLWNFGDGVSSSSTNPAHTYAAPGTYTVTLTVTDNGGYSHPRSVSVSVSGNKVRNDLNGDGTSDLVWFNTTSFQFAYWMMSNTSVLSSGAFGVPSQFRIVATADLDGDGRSDLIWRDINSNVYYYWRSRGDGQFDTGLISGVPVGWLIERTTDLNGDGRDDIIWRNAGAGLYATWYMNGVATIGQTAVFAVPSSYSIVATGDLDGDGRGDIVWTNPSISQVYAWRSRGDGTWDYLSLGGYGAGWNIVDAADISGDGRSDLIWENTSLGLFAHWFMNGATTTSAGAFSMGATGRVVTAGDFNADGRADVVIRTGAALALWRSQGTGAYDAPAAMGGAPIDWTLIR